MVECLHTRKVYKHSLVGVREEQEESRTSSYTYGLTKKAKALVTLNVDAGVLQWAVFPERLHVVLELFREKSWCCLMVAFYLFAFK